MPSYLTLERGTPVEDRFGTPVGEVEQVLCHGDGQFDGIVVRTPHGRRFVDAPEVRSVREGTIELAISEADVRSGAGSHPVPPRGLRRLLGGAHRIPQARWGRTEASDRDREAVLHALKRAYLEDRVTTDELADRVARAHDATTVHELEELLRWRS